MVSGILVGRRWEPSWLEDSESLGFYDAKGVVEGLLQRLGVAAEYEPGQDPYFRPRSVRWGRGRGHRTGRPGGSATGGG